MAGRFSIDATFRAHDRMTGTMRRMESGISGTLHRVQRRLTRLNTAFMTAHRGLASVAGGALRAGAVLGGGLVIGAGAAAFALHRVVEEVNKVADTADELAKRSRRLEFPIESLQEWGFVAEQSGMSSDQFSKNLDAFSKRVGEAKGGIGTLTTTLKKMDPSLLKQIKATGDTEQAMGLYLDAIRKVEDPTKRAALATAAFGRGGLQMLQITDQSSDAVKRLREEMRANGVLTLEQAEAAEAYNDSMNSLKRAFGGFMQSALTPLMPHLTNAARATREWILANREIISEKITAFLDRAKKKLPGVINTLMKIGGVIADVTVAASEWWEKNGDLVQSEFNDWLDKIRTNLPEIVSWTKRVAVGIAVFYAFGAAVNVANLGISVGRGLIVAYRTAVVVTKGIVAAWTTITKGAWAIQFLYNSGLVAGKIAMYAHATATRVAAGAAALATPAVGALAGAFAALAAAIGGVLLAWDQLNKLAAESEGLGFWGIIGEMWEQGTFDPAKAIDAFQNQQAKERKKFQGKVTADPKQSPQKQAKALTEAVKPPAGSPAPAPTPVSVAEASQALPQEIAKMQQAVSDMNKLGVDIPPEVMAEMKKASSALDAGGLPKDIDLNGLASAITSLVDENERRIGIQPHQMGTDGDPQAEQNRAAEMEFVSTVEAHLANIERVLTTRESAEITIRDESGRAEETKSPTGGRVKIRLDQSGGL